MSSSRKKLAARSALALLLLAALAAPRAWAQNPDTMTPEASAAKAKQLLAQLIDAMGGRAYMTARESECSGRFSQFGHNADLTAYVEFKDYWRFPDNHRTDYGKKGNIIDSYVANDGWTMDHDGVSEQSSEQVNTFLEQLQRNPNHLLRDRLNEKGLFFRYAGQDLVDLKPVDVVEITDRFENTFRIAIQRENHLMVRFNVLTKDPETREVNEEITSFANYHPLDGVQTPLQVWRTRNGRKVFQAFYDACRYNPNLPGNFFTRAALEQRFQEVGSRTDKRKAAKAQR